MMRLPWFDYRAPRTLDEAARILAGEGPNAALIAGGTDLLPNMKRRQMAPKVLVSVRHIAELRRNGAMLGAGLTLTEIVRKPELPRGLRQAAAQVATASKRCVAMSSTDCAPALLVLGARVKLVSTSGTRELALEELYNNDGIDYLRRRPDEILTEVRCANAPSTYWKLRRRGAFDFPVLGVGAALIDGAARLALGAVASRPFLVDKANDFLRGKELTEEVIEEAGRIAASRAKPMDNADLDLYWRKDVTAAFVGYALRELRGDDLRETRRRIARYEPA